MPSITGGDQHHPAYDPRIPVESNQVLIVNDLYTINFVNKKARVICEDVGGTHSVVRESDYPKEVQEKIEELSQKS